MTRLRFSVLLFFLCVFPGSGQPAEEPKRIYYGTTASAAHLPVWVAKDAGLFARYGLAVEPVEIRGGSLIALVLITGDVPFSGVGAESVVAARAAGGDVVLLACPIDAEPVYLIARPEIKSPADLKGQGSAVTRYGSSTHFYLKAALQQIGLDPERDVTILQMGAGADMVAALESGRIAAAALTLRYAIRLMDRGWPVLADLSKTDLVYPASCVTSSRAYIRAEPKTTEDFLRAYVAAIALIRQDHRVAEKSFARWLREKDPAIIRRSVEAYARLLKPAPVVPDRGIENVVRDLARRRPEFKEYLGWPEPFRENGPLEKVLRERRAVLRVE